MKASLLIPLIALSAAPAGAQPVQHPALDAVTPAAPTLDLAISVEGDIDPGAVRTALAAELGVRIVDAPTANVGRLEVASAGGQLRVTFYAADGASSERVLPLPVTADDRVQLVTFVATNLVRDQISALLAALAVPPPAPMLAPMPVVVAPPPPAPAAPPVARPVEHRMPASIGLIPPLSVDRIAGENVTVGVGVYAAIGSSAGSTIASISGAADIKTRYMHGAQIAGAATVSDAVDGVQIAGAATIGRNVRGAQIAGAVTVADRMAGLQIAGGANIAGSVDGAQIGVVNVTGRLHGLQLGVVNIANDGDDAYPIGLLNLTRHGRVEVDGWVESTQMSAVALRHGPRHIQNIVAVGWSPDEDHMLAGLGLGYHGAVGAATFDLDAMNWWTNVWNGDLEQLDQLRATVAIPMGSFAVFAGAAANVYINDGMDQSASFHPVVARRTMTDSGVHVVAWPSVFAGVRMFVR